MSDGTGAVAPTWAQIVETIGSMDPAELAATMPAVPDTAELVSHFPELGAVDQRDLAIEGPHGPVDARLYRLPGTEVAAAFVWVHGGGFIGGDLAMPEAHWVALALAARGTPVLSVEYRKCLRGVHYPVPSDDVVAAWRWAVSHADELGTNAGHLHLGGASAGGKLTAGATKRLRDSAGPLPASLVLAYPLLHSALPEPGADLTDALARVPGSMQFTPDLVHDINLNYAGSEAAFADPHVFAGNGDVSGQPPVYILNSDADLLRASGEAYGEQLRAAGVPVIVELEPDTQHGHLNEPYTSGGQQSVDRIAQWLAGGWRQASSSSTSRST
jgi:acetyl esterase